MGQVNRRLCLLVFVSASAFVFVPDADPDEFTDMPHQ